MTPLGIIAVASCLLIWVAYTFKSMFSCTLTCFYIPGCFRDEAQLLLCISVLIIFLLFSVQLELLLQVLLSDLLHLLAVPVLLAGPSQSCQGLLQFGPPVPRVSILGQSANHVKTFKDIHDVVNSTPLHICEITRINVFSPFCSM